MILLINMLFSHLYYLIGVIALLFIAYNSFVVVGGNEVIVLERKYFGKKIENGRIFAMKQEVGIQIRNLMPGFHFLIPFIYSYKKYKIVNIPENYIGIVESLDGKNIPNNRIFGKKVEGHNSFQDGESFINAGGEKGVQIEILPPGDYRINPAMFTIAVEEMVVINSNEVGIVYAQDGLPLKEGQLFANSIENHSDYQDIDSFLKNGGQKGPQINVLKPGQYKINTKFFKVKVEKAVSIPQDKIGLVTANAGVTLPKNEVVGNYVEGHNSFQDGDKFLKNGGQKGRQIEYLSSGLYYLNTDLFSVEQVKQVEVPTGTVGVVTSFVGEEPSMEIENALSSSQTDENIKNEELIRETIKMPEHYKGVQHNILRPGLYPVNGYAYSVQLIDITNISVEWANNPSELQKTHFKPLQILSQDGFPITVSVQVIVRIKPQQAPILVAKVGSVQKLIKDVIDPIISSSFRNQASQASAMSFLQDRSKEQTNSEEHVRQELAKYNVECVSVLITNIELPQDLMDTQTSKIIAEQQIDQYKMQQKSAEERVKTEKTIAIANQQPELVKSEINVQIADQKKREKITLAEADAQSAKLYGEGESNKIKLLGDAEAYKIKALAQAEAEKIEKIGQANADAYKKQVDAVGEEGIVALESLKLLPNVIKDGIKLVPDIVIGDNVNSNAAFWASAAKLIPNLNINKIIDGINNLNENNSATNPTNSKSD